ncbi:MAG: hypothetical protein ACLFQV_14005, partial [Vulcanimicrobiota bacterium]
EDQRIFSRHIEKLTANLTTNKSFFEQLHKMSLSGKSSDQLNDFLKEVKSSPEAKEAFVHGLNQMTASKRGKLLMANLLKNDEVQIILGNKADTASAGKPGAVRADTVAPGTSPEFPGLNRPGGKSMFSLLASQTGVTQTQAKDTRIFSNFDGLARSTTDMLRVHNAIRTNLESQSNYTISNSAYSGRLFNLEKYKEVAQKRMTGTKSSSNQEKVQKIWIELNRRRPPVDPREIYKESQLHYQRLCKRCGHEEKYKKEEQALLCEPCHDNGFYEEILSSSIKYRFRGGYINTSPDAIMLTPQAKGMYSAGSRDQVLWVQTTRLLPTLKDMLQVTYGKTRQN